MKSHIFFIFFLVANYCCAQALKAKYHIEFKSYYGMSSPEAYLNGGIDTIFVTDPITKMEKVVSVDSTNYNFINIKSIDTSTYYFLDDFTIVISDWTYILVYHLNVRKLHGFAKKANDENYKIVSKNKEIWEKNMDEKFEILEEKKFQRFDTLDITEVLYSVTRTRPPYEDSDIEACIPKTLTKVFRTEYISGLNVPYNAKYKDIYSGKLLHYSDEMLKNEFFGQDRYSKKLLDYKYISDEEEMMVRNIVYELLALVK